MSHHTPSNGRPEPEVIVNFADGLAYSKGKMEEAFRNGILDKPAKSSKEPINVKRDHVDLIVQELEISRAQAEKVLAENGGDLSKALESLVAP